MHDWGCGAYNRGHLSQDCKCHKSKHKKGFYSSAPRYIWIQESPISIKQSMDIKLPGNIAKNLIKILLNEGRTEMIRKHASYVAKKAIGKINVRKRSPNQGLLPYVIN